MDFKCINSVTGNKGIMYLLAGQSYLHLLSDFKQEPKLFVLIKTFQIHRHTKICEKYKNGNCWFHYGRFFTDKTINAGPLSDEMTSNEKLAILE